MTLMNKSHGAGIGQLNTCSGSRIRHRIRLLVASHVVFHIKRFAFVLGFLCGCAYMSASKRAAPLHNAKATRLSHSMETEMKLFARFFAPRKTNLTTALERQRLARTMPGQTGAVAAARLGILA